MKSISKIEDPEQLSRLCSAVKSLRITLRDTQQEFASRLGLAISTVVRYEHTRPPRGKALAQLENLAFENGLDQLGIVFRDVLHRSIYGYPKARNEQGRDAVAEDYEIRNTPEQKMKMADIFLRAAVRHCGPEWCIKRLEEIQRNTG